MSALRVVVADDSALCREALRALLEAEGDIEVVGVAADGDGAVDAVRRLRPDLATLDVRMPGTDGLEALRRIMASCPCPVLVVTAEPVGTDGPVAFEAVRRGALDVAAKPAWGDLPREAALRALVRRLGHVPVVLHAGRGPRPAPAPSIPAAAPDARVAVALARVEVVGIGASAGGPGALASILGALPADLAACVAVVQHLPPGFAAAFARFLQQHTALRVHVVRERTAARAATVLLADDDRHLVASPAGGFESRAAPPACGHRPSVDVLFASVADAYGPRAAGVVLSGIGSDGAQGLLLMRQAGALTMAQDERDAIVFGMPRAAVQAGAAQLVLGTRDLGTLLCLIRRAGRPCGPPEGAR